VYLAIGETDPEADSPAAVDIDVFGPAAKREETEDQVDDKLLWAWRYATGNDILARHAPDEHCELLGLADPGNADSATVIEAAQHVVLAALYKAVTRREAPVPANLRGHLKFVSEED
jgi:hypothetical protein